MYELLVHDCHLNLIRMLSMLSIWTLLVNCAISLLLHLLLFYLGDNCCILKISRYQLES